MNIQQLTYIVEIANCKSISRAAEYLFVSQPALSQQIRNLEKELGYRVFHRTSKGLELTEKGNVFYQKAQEMLKDWNRFKEEVISGTEHKKLKIGLGARVYSNRLFPKIARYFERHPELEVTFIRRLGWMHMRRSRTVPLIWHWTGCRKMKSAWRNVSVLQKN